jgi:hypothetical protein
MKAPGTPRIQGATSARVLHLGSPMKRALRLLLPVFALGLASTPARAQPAPSMLDQARQALDEGRFADAERMAKQAAGAGGPQRLAAAALEARVLASQGKVDAAIGLLDPQKAAAGAGGRRVRLELGELLIRAGRRHEAEPLLMEFANE